METILLVDGHAASLRVLKQVLEDANFTVLAASSVKQAIRMEEEFPGTIDLLLSDITVKGTSGPELANQLKQRRPRMQTMFLSRYPGGALLVLDHAWHYYAKPLVPAALVSRIDKVLRGEAHEPSAERSESRGLRRRPMGRAPIQFRPTAPSRAGRRG